MNRDTPSRYDAPAKHPAPGSTYAFLFTGLAIADTEPRMPLWVPPIDVADETEPLVRAYFRRTNPDRRWFEGVMLEPFIETLRRTSIQPTELVPPYSPVVRELIDVYLAGQRAMLLCRSPQLDLTETRTLADGVYHRELVVRTIIGTQVMMSTDSRPPTSNRLCQYLNHGHRREERALTRHSIRSAWLSFRRGLLNGPGSVGRLALDVTRLAALEGLRQRAREDRRFRNVRGEDLALAIHEDFDLNESIWRASRRPKAADEMRNAAPSPGN